MSKGWTKERVLFFVAAALFLLVMIKLGLVLSHHTPAPGAPTTSPVAAHQGDSDLTQLLAPGDLASLQQRGSGPLLAPRPEPPRLPAREPEPKGAKREKQAEDTGRGKGPDVEKQGPEREQRGKGGVAAEETQPINLKEKLRLPVRPPFRLAAIIRVEGQRELQAVLRHETTGEYHRVSVGGEVDGLRLEEIWDDGVILRDLAGRRHAYGDRFAATHGR